MEMQLRMFNRRLAVLLVLAMTTLVSPAAAETGGSVPGDARLLDLPVEWSDVDAAGVGARVSAPLPLEPDTMLVGADWGGDEEALVEVRTRTDGEWGEWTPLAADDHEGPDSSSPETSTSWSQPVIVASADAVQFRTDTPELEATGVVVGEQSGSVAAASTPTVSAAADNSKPAIVTRAQWGADESLRDSRVPSYASTVRFGVVHHTASGNDYAASQSSRIVRGIYEYHTKANGWWDIGYNFIVDKYGQVFEGRYGGVDRAVQGAHASGFNEGAVGVAVLGNYAATPITTAARSSLEHLLAWKFTIHHVDPQATTVEVAGSGSRHTEGQPTQIDRIVGHRHLGYTECPGSIYDLIERGSVAANVAQRMGQQIYTDAPDRLGNEVIGPPTTFTARTRDTANWRLDVRNSSGATVRTQRWQGARSVDASWDHKDANGNWVVRGNYSLVLSATLTNGQKLPAVTLPLNLKAGLPEHIPLVGDWNGDGDVQPGWWSRGRWTLDDGKGGRTSFWYGRAFDAPVVGDWNGDGKDEIGIIRDREWHLRRTASGGAGDIVFTYGRMTRGDIPLVGNWDGRGGDTIGIVRDGEWHLRNSLAGGIADHTFIYGRVTRGDIPVVGNWDGRGGDTIGIVRDDEWHLRNALAGGRANLTYKYGQVSKGDVPVVGDWDGNGTSNVGITRDPEWHLRRLHSGGPATTVWDFSTP